MDQIEFSECGDRTLVTDLRERLARIEARLADGIPAALGDHERRIRGIETRLNIWTGVFSVLQIAALAALGWLLGGGR